MEKVPSGKVVSKTQINSFCRQGEDETADTPVMPSLESDDEELETKIGGSDQVFPSSVEKRMRLFWSEAEFSDE